MTENKSKINIVSGKAFKALLALLLLIGLLPQFATKGYADEGSTITGMASISCFDLGSDMTGQGDDPYARFYVTMPDGQVLVGHCMDHTKYVPLDGSYPFTAYPNGDGTYAVLVDSTYKATSKDQLHPGMAASFDRDGAGSDSYNTQRVGDFLWTPNGYIAVTKGSTDRSTIGAAGYSLAGAQFGIYRDPACTDWAATVTTNTSGNSERAQVSPGTYYVKETAAPKGYKTNDNVFTCVVSYGMTNYVDVEDEPLYSNIELTKVSANPDMTDGNSCYSIEGAVYGIYSDAAKTKLVEKLTTNANGYAKSSDIKAGTYYVAEITPSKGYALDTATYKVVTTPGATAKLNGGKVSERPQNDPTVMWVGKIDLETTLNMPQGSASLAGAEFTVRYYDGFYDSVSAAEASGNATRTWVVATDQEGRALLSDEYLVNGDQLYRDIAGSVTIPLGTVLIQETKAPKGYLLSDDSVYLRTITSAGSIVESVETYDIPIIKEQVYRGDIEFVKAKETDQSRLSGVPFLLTSKTTGESHVIVTDENGEAKTASSWNKHSTRTNTNDAAVSVGADGNYLVDENKLDPYAGVWFGTSKTDDKKGALPFDTYMIQELPVEKNQGLVLISMEAKVVRDDYSVNLGTLDNQPKAVAAITTSARNGRDAQKSAAADYETYIIDRVDYVNIEDTSGTSYTLTASLMDKSTGEPIFDTDGQPVQAQKSFIPNASAGSVEVGITFDSRAYAGKNIVVYEQLSLTDSGTVVAEHENLEDYEQTIRITEPSIATSASDGSDADKLVSSDPEARIVDTVTYKNLIPGEEYIVTGELYLKTTEVNADGVNVESEPFAGPDGTKYTKQVSFVPENANGSIDVEFTVDASKIAGKEIVVFETLTHNGNFVADHCVLGDEDQTVQIVEVEIATTATDKADGDKTLANDPEASIVDTVAYENCVIGKTYQLQGALYLKKYVEDENGYGNFTAEPLKNSEGNPIVAETTFTAGSSDGTVELTFPVDTTELVGKNIVVFEKLYRGDILMAEHADANDIDQTVTVGKIKIATTAKDGLDSDKTVVSDVKATVVDTISYTGVIPGVEYEATGWLMGVDKDGKATELKDASDNRYTATTTFTPEEPDGEVQVTFEFNCIDYAGSGIVVFEELKRSGVLVAEHKDKDDKSQTVSIGTASIQSSLLDEKTDSAQVSPDSEAVVIDTIYYNDVVPGREYKLYAMLYDPDTELPLVQDDDAPKSNDLKKYLQQYGEAFGALKDNKEQGYPYKLDEKAMGQIVKNNRDIADRLVTAETVFTPSASAGDTTLTYKFDARGLDGKKAVSHAVLVDVEQGTAICGETAFDNDYQTIEFTTPKIETTATDATDGDKYLLNSQNARITDTVTYENLTKGKEYVLVGTLMDKATGEAYLANDEPVTAEKQFVPAAANGSVDVEFEFDATAIEETDLVVYEQLYRDMETTSGSAERVLVATHEDIDSESQTVLVAGEELLPQTGGEGSFYDKTGDFISQYFWLIAVLAAVVVAAGSFGFISLRKRNEKVSADTPEE